MLVSGLKVVKDFEVIYTINVNSYLKMLKEGTAILGLVYFVLI